MQFILDHLSAMIITSVVVLIVVMIQVRGSYSIIESHISDTVQKEMHDMHDILEWEISNMTTSTQTAQAISEGRFHAPSGTFTCSFTQTGGRTTSFTFPTLDIPLGTADSLIVVDSTDVIEVRYSLIEYGDSIRVQNGGVDQIIPLFRLERAVNDTLTGYINELLTDFRIQNVSRGAGPNGFTSMSGPCPPAMKKIRYEYRMAMQGMEYINKEQRSRSNLNTGQFGLTVNLNNW